MFTTHTEQLFKRAIYFELGLAQHALIFTLHDLLNPWDILCFHYDLLAVLPPDHLDISGLFVLG